MGISGENIFGIYVIRLVYHTETDMNQFDLKSRFFVENQEIKNDDQFKKDVRYDHIIKKLSDVEIVIR